MLTLRCDATISNYKDSGNYKQPLHQCKYQLYLQNDKYNLSEWAKFQKRNKIINIKFRNFKLMVISRTFDIKRKRFLIEFKKYYR